MLTSDAFRLFHDSIMNDQEQLEVLKRLREELQQFYLLLRSVRSDLTKITENLETLGEQEEMEEELINLGKRKQASEICAVQDGIPERENGDLHASTSPTKKQKTVSKRRRFSFKEKEMILRQIDTESIALVCYKYGLNDRTLRKWTANRKLIEEACEKESVQNFKKNSTIGYKDLEDVLHIWYLQAKKNGVPVSGTMLKDKALALNKELGGSDAFKASDGWLGGWKQRKEIPSLKMNCEKLPADVEAWNKYKKNLASILNAKRLTKAQVFNLEETGLSYKLLPPKKTPENDKVHPSVLRNQKERVTLGVCSNADGSLKLRLIVIGKSPSPRALKNLRKDRLPVFYRHEKNSLMDAVVLENWFKTEFVPQVQAFLRNKNLPMKALLVVGNSMTRNNSLKMGEIETTCLPFDINSVFHPAEQSILVTLKRDYKFRLVKSIFDAQENNVHVNEHFRKVTIKEMISWTSLAWEEISPATILEYWSKIWPDENRVYVTQAGDLKTTTYMLDSLVTPGYEETTICIETGTNDEILDVLQRIKGHESTDEKEVHDWVTAVEAWGKPQEFSDSEIIAQVRRANDEGFDN